MLDYIAIAIAYLEYIQMHSPSLSENTTMSTLIDLPIPSGLYLVIYPYYDMCGVVATVSDQNRSLQIIWNVCTPACAAFMA